MELMLSFSIVRYEFSIALLGKTSAYFHNYKSQLRYISMNLPVEFGFSLDSARSLIPANWVKLSLLHHVTQSVKS